MCAEVRMDFTAFIFFYNVYRTSRGVGLKCARLLVDYLTFPVFPSAQMKTKCWCCFVCRVAPMLFFPHFNELLSHLCTLSIDFHASNSPPYLHLPRQFYITVHHFSHIKSFRSHSSHLLPYFPVGPQHHLVYLILFPHCKTTYHHPSI